VKIRQKNKILAKILNILNRLGNLLSLNIWEVFPTAKIRGKKTTSLIPYFLKSSATFAHALLCQETRANNSKSDFAT
jgi:hypothetical protein